MSESLRKELIDTALAMNSVGLNQGASGNLSVRVESGMLITPTALPYERLDTTDIVLVSEDGAVEGGRRPSSEWQLHSDVYAARPEVSAVLHAHPVYCSALACLRRPIPAFHYMVARAGGADIRCAGYDLFGSRELSRGALNALENRKACLLANHGLVCIEQDLERVLELAVEVEHLARTYLTCLSVEAPEELSEQQMTDVLDKFRSYRPE